VGKTYKKRTIKFRKTGGVGDTGSGSMSQRERERARAEMIARQNLHEKARAANEERVLREAVEAEKRERNMQKIHDLSQKKFEYERPDSVDYIYPPIKATETGLASWPGSHLRRSGLPVHGVPFGDGEWRPSGIKKWGANWLDRQEWLAPIDWAEIWKTSKPGLGQPGINERVVGGLFGPFTDTEVMYDITNDPNIDPDDPIKAVPPNYRVHQGNLRSRLPQRDEEYGEDIYHMMWERNQDDLNKQTERIAAKMEKDWEDNENMRKMTKILVKLWKTCQNTSLTDYERRDMYNHAKRIVDKMVREKGASKTKEYLVNAPGAVIPYPLPRFEHSCGISQFTDDELPKAKKEIAFDAAEAAFTGDDPRVDKRVGSPQSNIDYLQKQDEDERFKGISDLIHGGRYKKNRKTIKHKKKRKLRKSKKKY
jgi:hypothetical protein